MKLFLVMAFTTVCAFGQNWDALAERFFAEAYFPYSPSAGTSAGLHQYDGKLEDYSKASLAREKSTLHKMLAEVEAFPVAGLSASQAADRELILGAIQSSLQDLEIIRSLETNPDRYSSTASNAAFVIMSRKFAPAAERLKLLIERERQMPKLFTDARTNLRNPPKVFTEIALEQLPGIVSFFETDVPSAFTDVKDQKLLAQFKTANTAVIQALKSYEIFLKKEVLPKSKGSYRLGEDTFRKKLLYDEMVDIPLDRLLKIGYENLRLNQQRFKDTAAKIDPAKTPQQILEEAQKDHPPADGLLDAFRNTLGGLLAFIEQHHIISIPSKVLPVLEETPPFERATTSASMDTPGPYEKVATEAYFNVTLPEKTWSKERIEEHMQGFNRGTIISTAIHETYPGHYTQFLWVPSAPSKTRRLLGASSNAEGWAHYCEQMLLDEGYGSTDLKLRLGQLQDALLRNARYIVAIQMHTGNMTFDQAVDFFVKEGYQTKAIGTMETKRGTSDATYLYYTLGKLQILKLREDYRAMKGSTFSLEEFHTNFLKQGFPPIKIVRKALLGNDSPVL